MPRSFQALFSKALAAAPERLHFAAHSHHYWPDAALEGHAQAAALAVQEADEKWSTIFADTLPRARRHIANILSLPEPSSLALAPNTHELVARAVSAIDRPGPARVLTTDGEFHSFERQARRWEEAAVIDAVRVAVEPFDTFPQRFLAAVTEGGWDLVFVSQVFFNSGFVNPAVAAVVEALEAAPETMVIIDGYHGFAAIPTDLSALASRVFYTSGGYKYAMAGEGCCFMHCPAGWAERPVHTGWFAGFGELSQGVGDRVGYASDGMRMMGATFDPTPWFRFNAVWDRLKQEGIDIAQIHAHVGALQSMFLELVARDVPAALRGAERLPGQGHAMGHFVTFRTERAGALHEALRARGVLTDYRGDRLRFGFGLYHEAADVVRLVEALAGLAADAG